MAESHISVNITDPDVSVDTLIWTQKHVYVDLSDPNTGLVVTLNLTDLSVVDFCALVLRGAGVKSFAFNDVPTVTAEYYGDDEDEYFADPYGSVHDFVWEDEEDQVDEVDEYGYSYLTY